MRTEDVHQRQDEWRAFGADGKAVAGTSGLRNDSTAKCLASEHKKPRKKEDSLSIWSIPQDVSIILFLETRQLLLVPSVQHLIHWPSIHAAFLPFSGLGRMPKRILFSRSRRFALNLNSCSLLSIP